MMPSPWLILAFLISLGGVFGYGHHKGYQEKETEDAIAIAQTNQKLNEYKEKADVQLAQTKKQLAAKQGQLLDAIRSGNQRLYVNVRTDSGNSSSVNGETRAELDSKISESLISITNEGDTAIVELNSCIDQYSKMREIVHGKR